ncbi:mannan endo-1,4-beta-mannosidase 5-like isoform X3 [Durio zibethinus]|uniref:mannan endo-1,4-beta-mannosidase n=1 Tax=Durio zibethinus TaxID=66656 RepID=A0A6P6AH06_DURZI|nr:mannan endo-1,4-beta-mannosidase 5-like isoform X3 [Durio zibethinus]
MKRDLRSHLSLRFLTIYRKMVAGNGLLYPILGFASCVAFIYMSFGDLKLSSFPKEPKLSFVERNGTQFLLDGKPLYVNGWNSYWLMAHSVDENRRPMVSAMLQAGAKMGLTVCRTWAFNDGGYDALQISPRQFDERVFKTVLTRKNTITGIEYRNDPTIFAWELMNEPRCMSDPSGDTLQDWLEEMSAFIKSIDKNHLLTIGLEGFYGPKSPKKSTVNPEEWASTLGSDFVHNSNITNVDFTSVHIYPDHWFHDLGFEEKRNYVSKWVHSHIEDCDKVLKKPVMFTEYGLSNQNKDFQPSQREQFYRTILDIIYKSAKKKGSGAGALVWQFFVEGMEEYNDDFGLVPWESPSIYKLTIEQSCRLARIQEHSQEKENLKELCSKRD